MLGGKRLTAEATKLNAVSCSPLQLCAAVGFTRKSELVERRHRLASGNRTTHRSYWEMVALKMLKPLSIHVLEAGARSCSTLPEGSGGGGGKVWGKLDRLGVSLVSGSSRVPSLAVTQQ